MKKTFKFFNSMGVRIVYFLLLALLFVSHISGASTQEERLVKIDEIGQGLTNKVSTFLGCKPVYPKKTDQANTARTVRKVGRQRSQLIHPVVYACAEFDQLIFFYRGSDQESIKFSNTLNKYNDEVGMVITSYTLDGKKLDSIPNAANATSDIIEHYFGSADANIKTPTLILKPFDSYSITVSQSNVPYLELINRINDIAEKRQARDPNKYRVVRTR